MQGQASDNKPKITPDKDGNKYSLCNERTGSTSVVNFSRALSAKGL